MNLKQHDELLRSSVINETYKLKSNIKKKMYKFTFKNTITIFQLLTDKL